MGRKLIFALNILTWLLLVLFAIASIFQSVGLDTKLYFKLQMRENVPEAAGISTNDLMYLNSTLSLHLRGLNQLNEPLIISVNGVMQPAFNEREIQHMQDCQRLFGWLMDFGLACKILFWIVLTVSRLVEHLLYRSVKIRYGSLAKSLWIGSGIILVPLAIFALWAAVDFSSAFTFFHKLLFTNDLWLLDPRTDLLINICPSSMFAGMGLRIALYSAGILLGVPLLASLLNRIFDKRKKEQNEVSDL